MLRRYFILSSTLVAANFFTLPALAKESNFSQIYIFGNSISDTGNVYSLTDNTFPPSPLYYEGRFSDGPIWVDFLGEDIGLTPGNFYDGDFSNLNEGINFSIGGATSGTTTLGDVPSQDIFFPGVATQVDNFKSFLGDNTISEDALIVLWAGENDYAEALLSGDRSFTPATPVNNITSYAADLADLGAKNIIISNLVDLGSVPLGQDLANPDELNQLTEIHNGLLNSGIDSLKTSYSDTNFMTFDINSLLRDISSNPTNFGIDLAEEPFDSCLTPNNFPDIAPNVQRCANPDEYIYYDNQHFTSTVQNIIADNLFQDIETKLDNNSNTTIPEAGNTIGIIGLGVGLLTVIKRRKL